MKRIEHTLYLKCIVAVIMFFHEGLSLLILEFLNYIIITKRLLVVMKRFVNIGNLSQLLRQPRIVMCC